MASKTEEKIYEILSAAGFDELSKINSTARTADIYRTYYPKRGLACAVKVYKDSRENGLRAQRLFDLELLAMKQLGPTGRVPEIIYSSASDAPSGHSQPPHFIVKPYYENFLDRVIRGTPPLELLEHAAQQADISDQLLKLGCRDLDGSFMNDAIDEQGRIVRVDLDGTWASTDFGGKLQKKYQTEDEFNRLIECLNRYHLIFSNAAEVSSLAVRISRLLLGNEEEDWAELRAVTALRGDGQKPQSHEERTKTFATDEWRLTVVNGIKNFFKKLVPQKADTKNGVALKEEQAEEEDGMLPEKTPAEAALEAWEEAWHKGVAGGDTEWWKGKLKKVEARLLALLTFHILSREEHGFHVRDVYESLLLLTLAAIEHRWRVITNDTSELSDYEQKQFMRFVENLYEVRLSLEKFAPLTTKDAGVDQDEPTNTPAPMYEAAKLVCSGGAWGANKKGPDWQCQDLVLGSELDPAPFFILADGATGANGGMAVERVKAVVANWVRPQKYNSLAEAKDNLCRLVKDIHADIVRLRNRTSNKNFETTLVAATLYNSAPNPVLLLLRYGNSGFLATRQREGENVPEEILDSRNYDSFPDPIGSRRHKISNFNPRDLLEVIHITEPGVYRVRAFSDGVGTDDQAWELLGTTRGIEEVTAEARSWPSAYGHIGLDDWSITGFDIEVVLKSDVIIDSPWRREAVAQKKPVFPWAGLGHIPANYFKLTAPAMQFWKNALKSDAQLSELAQYTLIKNLFHVSPAPLDSTFKPFGDAVLPKPAGRSPYPPATPHDRHRGRRGEPPPSTQGPLSHIVGFMIVAVVLIVFALMFAGVFERDPKNQEPTGIDRPAAADPTPAIFKNARQEDVYQKLKSGRESVIDGLPGGSSIESEPLQSFLPDLAAVLVAMPMNITIEVHTDPDGEASGNKANTDARKRAIEEKLRSLGVNPAQISVTSHGETKPLSVPSSKASDYRRLAIRLKSSGS